MSAAQSLVNSVVLGTRLGDWNIATLSAVVGGLYLARLAFSFLQVIYDSYLAIGSNIHAWGGGKGGWVVVTGASDGIGKEFALQLAKAKYNVFLLARSQDKLEAVAEEARKSGVQAIAYPFDFSTAIRPDYVGLATRLESLPVGILINNVAMNHEGPTPFLDESDELIQNIVNVNILAQLKITKIVLPQMVTRKKGLILNVGSVSGQVPSAYIADYSGSKAFVRSWSQALAMELKNTGIHVEHLNAYFVVSNMSKIRKPSWTTPLARDWVRSVLAGVGTSINRTPYPSHALISWALTTFFSEQAAISQSAKIHLSIRKRYLKKQQRLASEAKRSE
ncbi:uncharacterized protein BJ171DRAFT_490716 [Polychytrium aggregatum]|uniref:uncharacterized protein n=1 Tax=Polychytrium aggregatum TaxID=110093 RepID=UPI0022FE00DD|nr:uncharacterized protein BJ171DRAFT_490716 [Polychytrium aggregatum]KAI9208232.1 hypothetical protein BJ171DRAFT_490716 [Polychytrium aggregatum]